MRVGEREQPGRVRRVHERRAQPGGVEIVQHRLEAGELLVGVRVVGLVGHREVGEHAAEHELGALVDPARERHRVRGRARRPGACPVSILRCTGERLARAAIDDRLGERVDARRSCRRRA